MAKKKFDLGTVEVNDKDRYVYKFVKCSYAEHDDYDYLTMDLKVNNGYNHVSRQIYAIIRLIVPEGSIVVTPHCKYHNKCIKHRTNALIFDKVISYFYIDDSFLFNCKDKYVRLYSKDINKVLKEYNINKNQIKYYSAFSNVGGIINYRPNTILKPFEKLDYDVSTECASGLHFFFNMKELNDYLYIMMRR